MSGAQYAKVFFVSVLAPEIFCSIFWLLGFDGALVRASFILSFIGVFVMLFSVILFGFIEVFGRYVYVGFWKTINHFSIIYTWSTLLPVSFSFFVLYFSEIVRPSIQIKNTMDVIYILLVSSLLVHLFALLLRVALGKR